MQRWRSTPRHARNQAGHHQRGQRAWPEGQHRRWFTTRNAVLTLARNPTVGLRARHHLTRPAYTKFATQYGTASLIDIVGCQQDFPGLTEQEEWEEQDFPGFAEQEEWEEQDFSGHAGQEQEDEEDVEQQSPEADSCWLEAWALATQANDDKVFAEQTQMALALSDRQLPKGWKMRWSPDDQKWYYYHKKRRISTFDYEEATKKHKKRKRKKHKKRANE